MTAICDVAPDRCSSSMDDESRLCARIMAEYRDMPGLTLTVPQAARFFDAGPERCLGVLAALVDAAFLMTSGDMFIRRSLHHTRA